MQVLDEYDEQSEVAERLRIRVRAVEYTFHVVFVCYSLDQHSKSCLYEFHLLFLVRINVSTIRCRVCHFSTSTKMGYCWKLLQPETKRRYFHPFLNTQHQLPEIHDLIKLYLHRKILHIFSGNWFYHVLEYCVCEMKLCILWNLMDNQCSCNISGK